MKIGIIVHSHTGNTLSVAERIRSELVEKGYDVELKRVSAENEDPKAKGPLQLQSAPDAKEFEVLLFGAPVWAFSLSTVMKAYLTQLPSLKGKKVGCFVTHMLPFEWMGGNSAMKQFKELCRKKGAEVFAEAIVNWSSKSRENDIAKATETLGKIRG